MLLATDEELRAALVDANIPTLLMVLVQLTGDERWLAEPFAPSRTFGMDDNPTGGLSEAQQDIVRAAALSALRDWRAAGSPALAVPDDETLARMMSACMGENVDVEYVPMLREEMGLTDRDEAWASDPPGEGLAELSVIVIGAGLAGVCAAIKLDSLGIDYVVIEKNDNVGGSWYENTYPGCRVDTPSHFYSYSFSPNAGWRHYYAPRDENHAYVERTAKAYGIEPRIRFKTEALSATYDDATALWSVVLRDDRGATDTVTANVVISAVGQLNRPSTPAIPGIETFEGPLFHSARWRGDVSLEGKRVAVVGTGASAMQIVPSIAGDVSHLLVFQRSPQWAAQSDIYKAPVPDGKRLLLAQVPGYAGWYRFRLIWTFNDKIWRAVQRDPAWPHPERSISAANDRYRQQLTDYIRAVVGDDELFGKMLPSYPPFGKRLLLDNGWYAAMTRDDVTLVTEEVVEVRPNSLVTSDGADHPVDVVIMATGFNAGRFLWPMQVRGRGGITIEDKWGDDDAKAFLGITVPEFPGLFMLYGPNTNLAHGGSVVFHLECQVRFIMGLLVELARRHAASVEVREEVYQRYVAAVDAAHAQMIWTHPGVSNWYKNRHGRVVSNSPWRLVDYWAMTREPEPSDFVWLSLLATGD